MPRNQVSNRPFPDELPRLLKKREITLRALAREVGSRMVSREAPVNVRHAERIAQHLGLQVDYFPEVREARVIEAVRKHPRLRDSIYFERLR
jgi:hypothetical protein